MSKYSLAEFVKNTSEKTGGESFELKTPHMLEVNLNGRVWTKLGSMAAYTGNMKFTRSGMGDQGMMKTFKKGVTGEGVTLTKAEGAGTLYLADQGKKIQILQLNGDAVSVNGNDVLAFEDSIEWDIKLVTKLAGMMAGGLFNVTLKGTGMIAISSHGSPTTLIVTPKTPVMTDPGTTVAWSANLQPQVKTDIGFKTLIGKGSGETFQMKFEGMGFVVVQPFEEIPTPQTR